jgi:CHASE3 domain sensor protein
MQGREILLHISVYSFMILLVNHRLLGEQQDNSGLISRTDRALWLQYLVISNGYRGYILFGKAASTIANNTAAVKATASQEGQGPRGQ